ncbi:MAG: AgmX/PglI C-terminal domain-containing protein [Myxococcaceae bacterium]|nr:MAG: AgmX/PglI C-terminal domain-containing protein [Myxococcaceae bacterium]
MALQTAHKLLRVGVIQDGRIVEEHHVLHDSVTIGDDSRNTIVLPATQERPGRFKVLENRANQFHLIIDEHMQGRVNLGSSDVDFDALRTQGLATRREDDTFDLPLQESARGKVELTDATLFFHFVPAPPEGSRPTLPPELKSASWRTLDRLFFLILAAMLVLYVLSVAVIVTRPVPVEAEVELEQLEDRFVRAFIPPQTPVKEEPKDTSTAPEKKSDDTKAPPKKSPTMEKTPRPAANTPEDITKRVSKVGILAVVGPNGENGAGLDHVLDPTEPGISVEEATKGSTVGNGNTQVGGDTKPKGDNGGSFAGIGNQGTKGTKKVDTGPIKTVKPPEVETGKPEVESGEVNQALLQKFIQDRKKSIQTCYENALKRDPSLKGKIRVRFDLTPRGEAANIDLEEDTLGSESFSRCIITTMKIWKFPFKPSDNVSISYPFIFSSGD